MSEKRHTVSESADKIVLKTSVKRGSGTRDQDKLDVKVKGSDPQDTARKMKDTIKALNGYAVPLQLRSTQPGDD